ncbi:MAG: hypothetical protein WCH43_11010, partial [Verrucomicrobiota bacterium]
MKRTIVWVDLTHDVIDLLNELELDVREADAALRVYMVTGDNSWGEEYRIQAFHDINSHLVGIR